MSGPVSDPKLICEMFRPCPHGLRPNACPYCLQPQTDAHQPWWKCGVLIGVGPAMGRSGGPRREAVNDRPRFGHWANAPMIQDLSDDGQLQLWICPVCFATVPAAVAELHDEWHDKS